MDLWDTIAAEASAESPLWGEALRPGDEREREPVFSPLGDERYALGLETIYEGYLLHYGRPRLFAPADADTALLLGDYLYAHGLVRIADAGTVEAVADLAALISLCAQLRADGSARRRRGVGGDGGAARQRRLETPRAALRDAADPPRWRPSRARRSATSRSSARSPRTPSASSKVAARCSPLLASTPSPRARTSSPGC